MPSIFSRIIAGDLPARIVWRDDVCIAMVDIRPLAPGHVLVIPIREVDHWIDLDEVEVTHLMAVARHIGNAQRVAFRPARIGVVIAGFEVPHAHVHVVPAQSMANFDFSTANGNPDPDDLDRSADQIRTALRQAGHGAAVE